MQVRYDQIDLHTLLMTDYVDRFARPEQFIGYCQQCNKYDRMWGCPKHTVNLHEQLKDYDYIHVLICRVSSPERTSSMTRENARQYCDKLIHDVRREVDAMLLATEAQAPQRLAFYAGSCHLCPPERCTRIERRPCRHPERMRSSLEALGFDLIASAQQLSGIEMNWNTPPDYLTLVSGIASTEQSIQLQWSRSNVNYTFL